jgi:hypothetical protein
MRHSVQADLAECIVDCLARVVRLHPTARSSATLALEEIQGRLALWACFEGGAVCVHVQPLVEAAMAVRLAGADYAAGHRLLGEQLRVHDEREAAATQLLTRVRNRRYCR